MTDKVDFVDAHFNGDDVRFRLDRKYAPMLEPHGGWHSRMRRLADGNWLIPDVSDTLHRAHPSINGAVNDVPRALEKNGAAIYAPLAMMVIAAALAGVDPDAAKWSDEDEDVSDAD